MIISGTYTQTGLGNYTKNLVQNFGDVAAEEKSSEESVRPSSKGDTVQISAEAMRLQAELIHNYEKAPEGGAGSQTSAQPDEISESEGNAGGSATGDASESLRKRLKALRSQMSSLAARKGGASRAMMNSLRAQIASMESQLRGMDL